MLGLFSSIQHPASFSEESFMSSSNSPRNNESALGTHAGGVRTQDFRRSRSCRRDDTLKQRKTVSVFSFQLSVKDELKTEN
jgi:hypothetical protein